MKLLKVLLKRLIFLTGTIFVTSLFLPQVRSENSLSSITLAQAKSDEHFSSISLAKAKYDDKLSSISFAKIEYNEEKSFEFFESIFNCWSSQECVVSDNFHHWMECFENFIHTPHCVPKFNYDVTLVGFVNFADGIGRHPILFKNCLEHDVKLNFLSTRDIPPQTEDAQLGLPRLNPEKQEDIGAVAILTDILADKALNIYQTVPNSPIKIAYTMFESTTIPYNWASILNTTFDMAVVPDQFLINVYKKCGVQIPMYVLPLPLMLHDFLKIKPQKTAHKPFVFGYSGGFWKRKNHLRVLEAFAAEFGNRCDVKLKLHGRFGEEEIIKTLRDKIKECNLTNVELIVTPYTWDEYLEFFKSIDCCVCLSMGEGFSITPREALACGKPCIVTNNTAQISICNTGTVRVVPSNILVPAVYDCHYDSDYSNYGTNHTSIYNDCLSKHADLLLKAANIGYQFDCTTDDVRQAMKDVYENYHCYLEKAKIGREWVKRYLPENLRWKYVNLVKPKVILFGKKNIIDDNFFMTNSKELYQKYTCIFGNE